MSAYIPPVQNLLVISKKKQPPITVRSNLSNENDRVSLQKAGLHNVKYHFTKLPKLYRKVTFFVCQNDAICYYVRHRLHQCPWDKRDEQDQLTVMRPCTAIKRNPHN